MFRVCSALVFALVLAACAAPAFAQDAAHSPEPPNIAALVQAPVAAYVALMLAKTYENVSYGRSRY